MKKLKIILSAILALSLLNIVPTGMVFAMEDEYNYVDYSPYSYENTSSHSGYSSLFSVTDGKTDLERQVEDEIVVVYKDDSERTCFRTTSDNIESASKFQDYVDVVSVIDTDEIDKTIEDIEADPNVLAAARNDVKQTYAIPNDPYYSLLWHYGAIKADKTWNTHSPNEQPTLVAVIDSGVNYNLPDLENRVIKGYDFFSNDSDPMDEYFHGTMVAGIMCAIANNNFDSAGVTGTRNVKVVAYRAGNNELATSALISAMYDAISRKVDVINMSYGTNTYNSTEYAAIQAAHKAGITLVAAAGNEGNTVKEYPASYNYVISCAATDKNNSRATFSQYNSTVDIAAPGAEIVSTWHEGGCAIGNGTSFSAPIVAGCAAMLLHDYPDLTYNEMNNCLLNTATDLGTAGRDNYFGYGLINFEAALQYAASLYPTTYKITASAGVGGSISPSGVISVTQGNNKIFTINVNSGYELNDVLIDGVSVKNQLKTNTYTFNNVDKDHTISVSFNKLDYSGLSSIYTQYADLLADEELYTPESFAPFSLAIKNAVNLLKYRNAVSQIEIDTAIQGITDAVNNLEEIVIVPPLVYSAQTDADEYIRGTVTTFTITTDANVDRIGLMSESQSFIASISSDKVISGDYAVWTIKAIIGTKGARTIGIWAALPNEELSDSGVSVSFVVDIAISIGDEDVAVTSVRYQDEVQANEAFAVTIKTSTTATKVGIFDANTGKALGKISQSYVDKNDTRSWTITMKIATKGDRTFSVKATDKTGIWSEGKNMALTVL